MLIENPKNYELNDDAANYLALIIELNGQSVKRLNIQDNEVDLLINISKARIFHNMIVFYGDYHSLQYVKNSIVDNIKEYNDSCILEAKKCDIRVTGSGYISHSVLHY